MRKSPICSKAFVIAKKITESIGHIIRFFSARAGRSTINACPYNTFRQSVIDPNILSLNVSITFCLSFGVLIHKICGSSSFLIFFNPQNLQKQFFPLYFSQSTGRRGTFLSEEQIYNCAVVPLCNVNCVNVKLFLNQPEINTGANLQIFL